MHIEPFGVELWMNEFENSCKHNLAETCVDSLTLAELLDLTGDPAVTFAELSSMRLSYGAIEGSARLRNAIAALYDHQRPENVLVTHGAIGANALVHQTLVSRGDRVVSVMPTYQQHASIPASLGADVVELRLQAEDGFMPDLDQLRSLATSDTSLIALNNPNNPTGALMSPDVLREIAAIADDADAWVLCDEVYRGTDQEGGGATTSFADLSPRAISTGSMSKSFSLAGLRLGWLTGPIEVLERVMIHRDYNTISVGMIDDHLAALALEHADAILERSRSITRTNLAILSRWVDAEPIISWVKPQSGTTALLRYDLDIPSRELCINLLEETGVLLLPGSAMGMEGWLRIGYANATPILEAGLPLVSEFLARHTDLPQ